MIAFQNLPHTVNWIAGIKGYIGHSHRRFPRLVGIAHISKINNTGGLTQVINQDVMVIAVVVDHRPGYIFSMIHMIRLGLMQEKAD